MTIRLIIDVVLLFLSLGLTAFYKDIATRVGHPLAILLMFISIMWATFGLNYKDVISQTVSIASRVVTQIALAFDSEQGAPNFPPSPPIGPEHRKPLVAQVRVPSKSTEKPSFPLLPERVVNRPESRSNESQRSSSTVLRDTEQVFQAPINRITEKLPVCSPVTSSGTQICDSSN